MRWAPILPGYPQVCPDLSLPLNKNGTAKAKPYQLAPRFSCRGFATHRDTDCNVRFGERRPLRGKCARAAWRDEGRSSAKRCVSSAPRVLDVWARRKRSRGPQPATRWASGLNGIGSEEAGAAVEAAGAAASGVRSGLVTPASGSSVRRDLPSKNAPCSMAIV